VSIARNFNGFVERSLTRLALRWRTLISNRWGLTLRFLFMVVAAVALGALSAVGIQKLYPQSGQAFDNVFALGGDAAQFRVASANPIREIYDDVIKKITTPGYGASTFVSRSPVQFPDWRPLQMTKPFEIDQKAIQRAIAAGINADIQRNYQRSQDLIQYGRNPMGWHGPPPH